MVDMEGEWWMIYITRPNYEVKLNRPLHNDRVGGAFKVQKSFQLPTNAVVQLCKSH